MTYTEFKSQNTTKFDESQEYVVTPTPRVLAATMELSEVCLQNISVCREENNTLAGFIRFHLGYVIFSMYCVHSSCTVF